MTFPYIWMTIWWMNIILRKHESVWLDLLLHSKYRPWKYRSSPVFHSQLILPYILNTNWWMDVILCDNESEWPNLWPDNKCGSAWRIFHGSVILAYVLKAIWWLNMILRDNESMWLKYWLHTNVGHSDLYFTFQWYFISSECKWFCSHLGFALKKFYVYWQCSIPVSYTVLRQFLWTWFFVKF